MSEFVELLIPVETSEQVEELRKIRNICRKFMTNNQKHISREQQQKWFKNLNKSEFHLYLVQDKLGTSLGYAVIAFREEVPWLTAGLLPEYRGKGLGHLVFQTMIDWCVANNYQSIMLDVLLTNENARRLYEKLGFEVVEITETRCVMRYSTQ